MSVSEYLTYLRSVGVKVRAQEDQLQINAPKGVLTGDIQSELRERKSEILNFLKQANAISVAGDQSIRPIGRDFPLPLSYQQLRLWQLIQLDPDSTAYNISAVFRLEGTLDGGFLEKCICEIARRHEILRTSFELRGGEPVQVISDQPKLKLSKIDLSKRKSPTSQDVFHKFVDGDVQRPFDLVQAPLLRTTLIRLNSDEHILIVVAHHIIFDGWSLDIFLDELETLYKAYSLGRNSPLLDIPIQYADFAYWQRKQMHTNHLEEQLKFWQTRLAGEIPALELPLDRSRKSMLTQRAAAQRFSIPGSLGEVLEQLSGQVGSTIFGTLYAALCTLLFGYTGQERVVFCSPIANRNQIETEPLIGYFNNLVVLLADLSGDPTFAELLDRIQLASLEAFDNQDIPFQLIADFPNLRSTHLTRGLFALEQPINRSLVMDGVEIIPINSSTEETYNDLSLYITQQADRELTGEIVYRTDLFDENTITQLTQKYRQLLEAIADDPNLTLSALVNQLEFHSQVALRAQRVSVPDRYVTAQSETEQVLVEIWESVFRHKPIGIRDDFFDLGGHSLLAVRLFAQIEKHVNQALSGKTILEAPTIEELAKLLQTKRFEDENTSWPMVQALKPEGTNPPFFYIGRGVAAMKIARLMKPEQPFYKLDMDRDELLSVEEMARLCSQKIQEIYPEGVCFLGGFCFDGFVAIETAKQLHMRGRQVALVALLETFLPENSLTPLYSSFYDRVIRKRLHRLKRIRSFEPEYRLRYLKSHLQEAFKWRVRCLKWMFVDFFFTSHNLPLPDFLHDVTRLDDIALQDYEVADYSGKLNLIYAGDEPDNVYNQTEWDAIAEGGTEMFFVPQACTHQDIINFNQPHAQIIVDQITSLIESALEEERGTD